jgi:CelD/BcsL family acetyltransferase involved in cellulose biosynthesis
MVDECLRAELVDAAELSDAHRSRWMELARLQRLLDSPPFDPEFVCGLAQHVPDAKIAILRRGGSIQGYLAFALPRDGHVAMPIPMCDYQPIILKSASTWNMREIARALNVRVWYFQNAVASNPWIGATRSDAERSLRISVRDGFDAYCEELKLAGQSVNKYTRQIRRLERDFGSAKLVHAVTDEATFQRLLRLKATRYGHNGVFPQWVRDALLHFYRREGDRIAGHLSVLKAGSTEVAYIYCLRKDRLLYYWFPTFNPDFSRYGPGLAALWLLIRDLPALGCDSIDLGPGDEPYKASFANAHLDVLTGRADANAIVGAAWNVCKEAERGLRSSTTARKFLRPALTWMRGYRSNAQGRN